MSVDVGATVGAGRGVSVASSVTVGLVVGGTSYLGVGMSLAGVSVDDAVGAGVESAWQALMNMESAAMELNTVFLKFMERILTQGDRPHGKVGKLYQRRMRND
jgi:hypothetical protein